MDLAAVRSRISQLDAESPPALIREVHLELLRALGRSIGFGFHEQMPLEPPTNDLIIIQGRFNRRAHGREFGLHLVSPDDHGGRWPVGLPILGLRSRSSAPAGGGLLPVRLRLPGEPLSRNELSS